MKYFVLSFLLFSQAAFAIEIEKFTEFPKELPLSSDQQASLNKDEIKLGERLFFDTKLSRDQSMSCVTCHAPAFSFSVNERTMKGVRGVTGDRNPPVLFNRIFSTVQMWDGRAPSLESQVLMPVQDHLEMDMNINSLVKRLKGDSNYVHDFKKVFGEEIKSQNIAKALAAFVKTIFAAGSPFDRYKLGEVNALNDSEKRGLDLFENKFKCSSCHGGFNFTNEKVMERCSLPGQEKDPVYLRKFKVPSLRNLSSSAPYFHNGRLPTLSDVLEFYQGCLIVDSEDKPIDGKSVVQMSASEKEDVLKFLNTLNGKIYIYSP